MSVRLAAVLFVVCAMVSSSVPALAGESWCEADPVLTIDGRDVDYTALLPLGYAGSTTVAWTFHIPSNVIVAAAVTPMAPGSPNVSQTVQIIRDQSPYIVISDATVVTAVSFASPATYSTQVAVKGVNASWAIYTGRSNKALVFATSYQVVVGAW